MNLDYIYIYMIIYVYKYLGYYICTCIVCIHSFLVGEEWISRNPRILLDLVRISLEIFHIRLERKLRLETFVRDEVSLVVKSLSHPLQTIRNKKATTSTDVVFSIQSAVWIHMFAPVEPCGVLCPVACWGEGWWPHIARTFRRLFCVWFQQLRTMPEKRSRPCLNEAWHMVTRLTHAGFGPISYCCYYCYFYFY